MVYAEVMLWKHVNWTMMTAHSRFQILRETIDIPLDNNWNEGFTYHAKTNELLQQGLAVPIKAPQSPYIHTGTQYMGWNHHDMGKDGLYKEWNQWDMGGGREEGEGKREKGGGGRVGIQDGMIPTWAWMLST
jgi:hypothetical protein